MQLIKTEYFYPDRKHKKPDKVILVLKDKDGNKVRKSITQPKFTYYITTKDNDDGESHRYIERKKTRPVTCNYEDLYSSIVEELNDNRLRSYYRKCFGSENINKSLRRIHLENRLHGTDINIEDYYINKFLSKNSFEKNNFGIRKLFFDIEVDSSEIKGFPVESRSECPINAISMVDYDNKIINEYLLSYEGNESYDKFISNIDNFINKISKKYKNEFDVNIYIFDEEIDLIQSFFDYINEIKPDYSSAWNMDYDFVYITNRLGVLGYEPKLIMCPKELKRSDKRVFYKVDNGNVKGKNKDISDKHSIYEVSGYTNYIDEMALYANITKPLGKEESYSLDYIGEKVTGMRKEKVVENMKFFHLVDYESFVDYSIHDSVMLAKIDENTNHLDLIHSVSMITRTKVNNAMKKTVSLPNMINYFVKELGLIKSNNRSALFEEHKEKIPGAWVANSNNIDSVGVYIMGLLSNFIFDCVADLDLASLYPSIIRAFNLSVDTIIGYVKMNFRGFKGDDFVQDYISGDVINFCNRYFNLPTPMDILNEYDKAQIA